LPSGSLESVFDPHTSSHGLAGAELTRLPLNALTSNQKGNCNASLKKFWGAEKKSPQTADFVIPSAS
jgi:hypothetical protein